MNSRFLEKLGSWAQALPGAYLDLPFGPEVYTYKVLGKIFLFIHIDFTPMLFTVKIDPDDSIALRSQYHDVIPGYHLNKRHWVSLREGCSAPEALMPVLIKESYQLVLEKIPRAKRDLNVLPDEYL